jgi:hypothetical protein
VRRRLVAAAAAVLVLVGACSQPAPEVRPDPEPKNPPAVVLPTQANRILGDLASQIDLSEASGTIDPLTRMGGAAREMRVAQFTMKAADPRLEADKLGTEFAGEIVAATDAWPRSFIAVTQPAEAQAPYLYLMTQADPRSNYSLQAWVRLVAPVTMPTTAPATVGSPVVALDDASLKTTPDSALAAYAVAKDAPSDSEAALFGGEPDPARDQWAKLGSMWSESLAQIKGKVTQVSSVVNLADGESADTGAVALATAEGGAIVIGRIQSALDLSFTRTERGESFSLPAIWAALGASDPVVTKQAHIDFTQIVALSVPPASSDDPITVLGVSQEPVAVTSQ